MELRFSINLISLFVVSVCFYFSGMFLNSLVIISFWRSAQLRRKFCYFMIMVLSCCDLLLVLINHPFIATVAMLWLTKDGNRRLALTLIDVPSVFLGFSLLALLVMNFDRYLATYYPIFHRTSMTRKNLLTLLAILNFVELVLVLMFVKFVVSEQVATLIFKIIFAPPLLFMNYKLFTIARRSRGNRGISPNMRKIFSFKSVSSCLLAVACFMAMSIPSLVYIGLSMNSKQKTLDDAHLVEMWAKTIGSMNATFNCLIFYWKNKILRYEGKKVIKVIEEKCGKVCS